MSDIVDRLRSWVYTDSLYSTAMEAAAEVERLRDEVDRLNREVSILIRECQTQKDLLVNGPAPAADGIGWPTSGAGAVLTDAEREALHWFSHYGLPEHHAATLRGLLGRME